LRLRLTNIFLESKLFLVGLFYVENLYAVTLPSAPIDTSGNFPLHASAVTFLVPNVKIGLSGVHVLHVAAGINEVPFSLLPPFLGPYFSNKIVVGFGYVQNVKSNIVSLCRFSFIAHEKWLNKLG
jgi:hypothetical protein